MKNKLHTYRKETVRYRRAFSSVLKLSIVCLLISACKETPSSPPDIDREDLLPAAIIISPPKSDIQKTLNVSPSPVSTEAPKQDSNIRESKPGKKIISDDKQDTTGKKAANKEKQGPNTAAENVTDIPGTNIFLKGSKIVFQGLGLTFQDDTLTAQALTWSSDINGKIGVGPSVERDDLDTGTHWITLTVVDHNLMESRDSVKILVTDADSLIEGPVATIKSLTDGLSLLEGVKLVLEGTGIDAEGNSLEGDNLEWSSSKSDEPLGTGSKLDVTGLLSTGSHTITLTVTDNQGNTATDSVNISIEPKEIINELPTAEITSIADITSLTDILNLLDDVQLILKGKGLDPEDGELTGSSLEWSSNLDGKLGTGRELDVTDMLSPGEHIIKLTVTDSEGETDADSVEISLEPAEIVEKLPVAKIISIADITSLSGILTLLDDVQLILKGTGEDAEGNSLEGENLEWRSNKLDEPLGVGRQVDVTGLLSPGEHTITLTVTDSEGNTDSDSADIRIHEPPVAEILSVAGISSLGDVLNLLVDVELILEATSLDPEDGELPDSAFSWESEDKKLGEGRTLDVTGMLSLGDHTITLTVTDQYGATDTDSVEISIDSEEVINEPPVAEILSVAGITSLEDVLNLSEDVKLTLEATGVDPEDGELPDSAFSWESEDRELGKGRTLDVTGMLSLGDHTITVTVTDSEGATDSDSVEISIDSEEVINEPPVAEILSVAGITSLTERITVLKDEDLILKGTGIDPEDGELSSTSLEWSSDIDGDLGAGEELNAAESLSTPGNHTITLKVIDQDGATDTESVEIRLHQLPEVKINSPADGEVLSLLDEVVLNLDGFAEDDSGQPLLSENHLEWSASLNDEKPLYLGVGNELKGLVKEIFPEAGGYTIKLTATDDEGFENSESVNIRINEPPNAKIISLRKGSIIDNLIELTMDGSGNDYEDGELSETSLVWSSNIDGKLGTGTSLTKILSLAEHTITLTVTDSDGASHSVSEEVLLRL